jgi:hypothetical protein
LSVIGQLALGDVLDHPDQARRLAPVAGHEHAAGGMPAFPSVIGADPAVEGVDVMPFAHGRFEGFAQQGALVRMHVPVEGPRGDALQSPGRQAQQVGKPFADQQGVRAYRPLELGHPAGDDGQLEALVIKLVFAQGLGGLDGRLGGLHAAQHLGHGEVGQVRHRGQFGLAGVGVRLAVGDGDQADDIALGRAQRGAGVETHPGRGVAPRGETLVGPDIGADASLAEPDHAVGQGARAGERVPLQPDVSANVDRLAPHDQDGGDRRLQRQGGDTGDTFEARVEVQVATAHTAYGAQPPRFPASFLGSSDIDHR